MNVRAIIPKVILQLNKQLTIHIHRINNINYSAWRTIHRKLHSRCTVPGILDWFQFCSQMQLVHLRRLDDFSHLQRHNYKQLKHFDVHYHCIWKCRSPLCMPDPLQLEWNVQYLVYDMNEEKMNYYFIWKNKERKTIRKKSSHPWAFASLVFFLMSLTSASLNSSNQKPGTHLARASFESSDDLAKFWPAKKKSHVLRHTSCSISHCNVL